MPTRDEVRDERIDDLEHNLLLPRACRSTPSDSPLFASRGIFEACDDTGELLDSGGGSQVSVGSSEGPRRAASNRAIECSRLRPKGVTAMEHDPKPRER